MRKRIALAAALTVIGVTAVIAQSDPIAARKALMKGNDSNARNLVKMMRGDEPYDQTKIDAAFAQWAETAQKFPTLFPDNSKTGGNTRATPQVWKTRGDFEAKDAAFGKAVAEYRGKVKNVDELKVAVSAVGKACDNCHEQYRGRAPR
jgi:cytochrome c556